MNIVVLGGGTAGWITALYAQRTMPEESITVIESSEIGILGAGEGTVPNFIDLLDFLGIPMSMLIKDAGATIKNSIKFTNWNGDGSSYHHSFSVFNGLGLDGTNQPPIASSTLNGLVTAIANKKPIEDIDFMAKISEENKVPFQFTPKNSSTIPLENFNQLGAFGLHFDAVKVAAILKEVAISRGIRLVDTKITEIKENEFGNISYLNDIPTDFVFDCSGFANMLIGKHYSSEWKSYSDLLPVDTAIPFFLDIDEVVPPYTEAIAMKYGWVWKIPLQHRYGCGYVFDSSLIDEENAKKELNSYFDIDVSSNKTFKFTAGYYKTPWVKNCIAVGLSSGFIEPLEATSIWATTMSLTTLFTNLDMFLSNTELARKEYNEKTSKIQDQIFDFVYFHYMSSRKDSEFWKKFKDVEKSPINVKNLLNKFDYRVPQYSDVNQSIWALHSWVQVAYGINQLNTQVFENMNEVSAVQKYASSLYDPLKELQQSVGYTCTDHRTFLEYLR